MNIIEQIDKIKNGDDLLKNDFIKDYMPFIINTISKNTEKYVDVKNSDELSIGMAAFFEAIQKYDIDKGNFLSFASLIIKNRVIDYIRKEYKSVMPISSLSQTDKDGNVIEFDIEDSHVDNDIKYEIEELQIVLRRFNISFIDLSKDTP
jgi:RNA polymerase sigma factor